MTAREKQILNLIKQNPMISQEELAAILKMKRSSVSVYISNLMKNGTIRGRGYIVDDESYVAVIGAANMDVNAIADSSIERNQNNIGTISFSPGGCARNIAENIARLGMNAKLISCFGNDMFGNQLLRDCRELGIDVSKSAVCEDAVTSLYVEMRDDFTGEPYGLSNNEMTDRITPSFLSQRVNVLNHARYIVVDSNLRADTMEYVLSNFDNGKIFCAVGSQRSAERIRPFIGRFGMLKLTLEEAAALLGKKAQASETEQILSKLANAVVAEYYVTCGQDTVCYSFEQNVHTYKSSPGEIVAVNGAGEAFVAGILYGKMSGAAHEQSVRIAFACARIAMESERIVNRSMCEDALRAKLNEVAG